MAKGSRTSTSDEVEGVTRRRRRATHRHDLDVARDVARAGVGGDVGRGRRQGGQADRADQAARRGRDDRYDVEAHPRSAYRRQRSQAEQARQERPGGQEGLRRRPEPDRVARLAALRAGRDHPGLGCAALRPRRQHAERPRQGRDRHGARSSTGRSGGSSSSTPTPRARVQARTTRPRSTWSTGVSPQSPTSSSAGCSTGSSARSAPPHQANTPAPCRFAWFTMQVHGEPGKHQRRSVRGRWRRPCGGSAGRPCRRRSRPAACRPGSRPR